MVWSRARGASGPSGRSGFSGQSGPGVDLMGLERPQKPERPRVLELPQELEDARNLAWESPSVVSRQIVIVLLGLVPLPAMDIFQMQKQAGRQAANVERAHVSVKEAWTEKNTSTKDRNSSASPFLTYLLFSRYKISEEIYMNSCRK